MKVLVTGSAGFIGYHLTQVLLQRGDEVVGLDNINSYYDVNLKYARLESAGVLKQEIREGKLVESTTQPAYRFIKMNLEDNQGMMTLCRDEQFDVICNLAAQPGVRYSLENPGAYVSSNLVGFANVLEAARQTKVKHLVYASSSSVYGLNEKMPFSTADNVDHPISLYAATKKSNELMAHTYSHLYNIPVTGLRFFTVYGPWGRLDMAPMIFTKAIMQGSEINVYNHGNMSRDFTYVGDIAKGIEKVIDTPPAGNKQWEGKSPDPASSVAPYKLYNIGNSTPIKLLDFIGEIEENLGMKAKMNMMPLQPGEVTATWADVDDLMNNVGYKPDTPLKEGMKKFIDWYKDFYGDAKNQS